MNFKRRIQVRSTQTVLGMVQLDWRYAAGGNDIIEAQSGAHEWQALGLKERDAQRAVQNVTALRGLPHGRRADLFLR